MVPHDIVFGILIELPVKALLRFKSVSKEWCSIINHPYFINLHLHQSMKTNRHNLHVIVTDNFKGTSIISLNSNSVNLRILNHPLKQPQKVVSGRHYILVVGSCNGLVCLMNQISGETAFWNISTGDYRVIPDLRRKRTKAETVIDYLHGLGHDSINDDYKLLRIARVRVRNRRIVNKSIVYSLRTNTWRRGEEVHSNFIPNFNRPGTFVCGALHWITDEVVQYRNRISITAFDVGTEKYRQLEPLDNMRLNPLVLGELGGCLCATETTSTGTGYRVNVWSMKDYGVKDSWTMLFSFGINTISWFSLRPLAYSKTQDKVLFESKFKKLSWHHLKDDEFPTYREWEVRLNSTEICMESLVQLP